MIVQKEDPFIPKPLPEHLPPSELADCQKCELAKQRKRVIWGEGNPDAPLVIILDNPGAREDRFGQPFVCGTRETLQKAALEVGICLDDLYVTFILKCTPKRAYNKELARSTCLPHLHQQFEVGQHRLAFCLGNVALQSFSGDPDAEVKNLRGNWQTINAIPTAVSYHPLAIRRRPVLYPLFLEDFRLVAAKLYQYQNHN